MSDSSSRETYPQHGGTVLDRLAGRPFVAQVLPWTLLGLDAKAQSIRLSFTLPEEFTNPGGTVHGGFINAMLDECMGAAAIGLMEAEYFPSTLSMATDFLRPVQPGQVYGEGHVVSVSGRTAFLEAKITDAADDLLARAVGSFRLSPFPEAQNSAEDE